MEVTFLSVDAVVLKHAYRYLHFKVILVQLDPNVCDSLLEEPGWSQHQHQLQVSRKRALGNVTMMGCSSRLLYSLFVG